MFEMLTEDEAKALDEMLSEARQETRTAIREITSWRIKVNDRDFDRHCYQMQNRMAATSSESTATRTQLSRETFNSSDWWGKVLDAAAHNDSATAS